MSDLLKVQWLIEGRLMRVAGTADKDAMAVRNSLVLEAIETAGKPPMVHCIIDHRQQYSPEEIATQAKTAKSYLVNNDEIRQKLLSHPMLGWVISLATPNMGLKMAGMISSQKDNYRWHSVQTIEEAFQWLQAHDTSLPDLTQLEF